MASPRRRIRNIHKYMYIFIYFWIIFLLSFFLPWDRNHYEADLKPTCRLPLAAVSLVQREAHNSQAEVQVAYPSSFCPMPQTFPTLSLMPFYYYLLFFLFSPILFLCSAHICISICFIRALKDLHFPLFTGCVCHILLHSFGRWVHAALCNLLCCCAWVALGAISRNRARIWVSFFGLTCSSCCAYHSDKWRLPYGSRL